MKKLVRVYVLVLVLILFSGVAYGAIPASERAALIAFYNSTDGDNWWDNDGWRDPPLHTDGFAMPGTENTWWGILVREDAVTEIFFQANHLNGTLPPELGNLTNLYYLYIGYNFSPLGSIPPELGNLVNLQFLGLEVTSLTGTIPRELGNLKNLLFLRLGFNNLTGSIPPELGNLSNLQTLELLYNKLSGSIPPELGNLSNLLDIYLSGNQLTGNIPTQLGNLSNLVFLDLRSNQLTGNIPTQLANMAALYDDYSDFRWNGLYTEINSLRDFLNSKQDGGDWESTQTIAPSNPLAITTGKTSIRVSWSPIVYTGDTGGYDVFYSTTSGGPYTFFNTTGDKTVSQMDVFGLNQSTTYYFVVRTHTDAHESNQNIITSEYSDEVFVSTLPLIPTVTTAAVTDITAATALCGGNVTSNGGAPVAARGVCWGTSPNPTTADNHTNDGNRAEAFTTTITGLTENTVYHVRAYAVNAAGTGYGRNVSFTTTVETLSVTLTEPIDGTDVAGTVTIKAAVASGVAAAADYSPLVLSKLEFYIDSTKAAEFTSGPYEYDWDTTSVSDGTHTIKAIAYNLENQTSLDEITVNVLNTPASPAHIFLNRTRLNYGVAPAGTVTGPQFILVNNTGEGVMKWTAGSDSQWLVCSPISGTGNGIVNVTVNPGDLAPGTYTAAVTVESPDADNSPQTVDVYLTVYSSTGPPSGTFDSPGDGSVVRSSVPVTGWVIDDIDVEGVKIYRAPFPGEGTALLVVGDAFLVEGARPDVETSLPGSPRNYRAGWGYMLLTYYLPNRGNGTYTLYAYAVDKEGNEVALGSKTITCDNANAVKPFGAIDTPEQGGTASGRRFENWGWALTPQPNTIPTDGSTISVYVDGVPLGHPVYNIYREDIAAKFPGYSNSNGAVGYINLDTTVYENGIHTIQWTVSDDAGNADGIGSRYFSVQNTQIAGRTEGRGARDEGGRRDEFPAFEMMSAARENSRAITHNELERLELHLTRDGEQVIQGGQVVGDHLRMLPVGSTLDKEKGIFYWSPGPGFSGEYRLVFAIKGPDQVLLRKDIIVTILPGRQR